MVLDDFLNNKVQKFLGEFGVEIGALRQILQTGNLLGLTGFDFDSIEQVRAACVPQDLAARLDNRTTLDA